MSSSLGTPRASMTILRLTLFSFLCYASTIPQVKTRDECPDTFSSVNNLTFNIYCDRNLDQNTLDSYDEDGFEDCLERCSISQGCWGVAFDESTNQCAIQTSSVLNTNDTVLDTTVSNVNSALVNTTQMSSYGDTCPYSNGSKITTSDDATFEVICGTDLNGADADAPWGTEEWGYPYHTEDYESCVQRCIDAHPLCFGITWDPDFVVTGWANCYLKSSTDWNMNELDSSLGYTLHSAIIEIPLISNGCTNESTTVGGWEFDLQCGQTNAGTNTTTSHQGSMNDCMEACVNSTTTCKGVIYDFLMQDGYKNCALLDSTSDSTSSTYQNVALVNSGTSNGTSSNSSSSGSITSGSSNHTNTTTGGSGWIAGAVVGAVAGVALIGAACWYAGKHYRSKTSMASNAAIDQVMANKEGYQPARTEPRHELGVQTPAQELAAPASELAGSSPVYEMPANGPGVYR